MKASELRIGNIIYRNVYDIDSDGNKDPDGNAEVIVTPEILSHISSGSNDYFPIPVTEERMNAFEGMIKKYDVPLGFKGDDFVKNQYSMLFNGKLYKIRYVHELQNIYFEITGKELSINA